MLNKITVFILALMLVFSMVGCAKYLETADVTEITETSVISDVSEKNQVEYNTSIDIKNVDYVELNAYAPRDTEVIGDYGIIKHITDNVNALMLVDMGEADIFDQSYQYQYQLTWFSFDKKVMEEIYVIDADTIIRNGHYYNTADSGSMIDTDYYTDILSAPIRIKLLDKIPDIPDTEGYYEYISSEDSGIIISLSSTQLLTDICFSRLEDAPDGRSYGVEHKLYTFHELRPERWFAADVVFYGSMTTYGISFQAADGQTHRYAIKQSGRNGALILTEN